MRPTALVLGLSLTLWLPAAGAEAMVRPSWAPGDTWDFVVTGRQPTPEGPRDFAYVGKMVVAARESVHVDGAAVPALRIVELTSGVRPGVDPDSLAGKPLDFRGGARFTWVRESDGATLRRAGYHVQPDGRSVLDTNLQYTTPCDEYGWPYEVGREHKMPCVQEGLAQGEARRNAYDVHTKVVGRENVTVPAGTFETFTVHMGVTTPEGPQFHERQDYAPAACWRVRAEGLGTNAIGMRLLGFRCGTRTGGALSSIEPPLDPATLQLPLDETPSAGPGVLLALLGVVALVRARRP